MRIITWNINSVRIRIHHLKEIIDRYDPDIIALQETKVQDQDFPLISLQMLGYQYIYYSGEKSYNGVAIISRIEPSENFALKFCNNDCRHIALQLPLFEIHNFYVPAGGDEPDINTNPKFKHKLEYIDQINNWFKQNRSPEVPIILLGDLNIAPLEHDVWSSRQLRNVVSHTDIEREKMITTLKSFQWIDAPRLFHPESEKLYSWWSYRNRNWRESNRGRRLDHIWVSQGLKKQIKNSFIDRNIRDQVKGSDHVPVILDLA